MNFWFIGSVVLTQAGVSSRFVTKRSSPLAKTSYCRPDQGGASLRLVSGAANCRPWGECRPLTFQATLLPHSAGSSGAPHA
jgi:hypothetical protein